VAVPEEVHAAKRINSEGERIIEQAQEEAARIIARAQEQAAFLIGERGLTEAALDESRRIVEEAGRAADDTRLGADSYAVEILENLQAEVRKALAGIEKGIDVLAVRQAELRGEEPALASDSLDDGSTDEDASAPEFVREEDASGQTVPR
jgi:hypothetical protein